METALSFYSTLLTIEFTVFGIIAAVIFTFIQIIYSSFSYREIKIIYCNPLLIIYFALSIITLLATVIASYSLSFPDHNFIPNYNLNANAFFHNAFISIIILQLFLSSIIIFIIYIFFNLKNIRPSRIAIVIGTQVKVSDVKLYLLKVVGCNDPFEPLHAMILRSINNMDFTTLKEALNIIVDKTKELIQTEGKDENGKKWNPHVDVVRNYIDYITNNYIVYMDMCERNNLDLAKNILLEYSDKIMKLIIERNNVVEISILMQFWVTAADQNIGKSKNIFFKVTQLFRDTGEYAFEHGINSENEKWLDVLFRKIGLLGEIMINKLHAEEELVMDDNHDILSEYDELFDIVLKFGNYYETQYVHVKPTVYLGIVHFMYNKLIDKYTKNHKAIYEKYLYHCSKAYYDFSIEAIIAGNYDGANLAVTWLDHFFYRRCLTGRLDDMAQDILSLLITIAGHAAGFRNMRNISKDSYPIEDYVSRIMLESPFQDIVREILNELLISCKGNKDDIKVYVFSLRQKLELNFSS